MDTFRTKATFSMQRDCTLTAYGRRFDNRMRSATVLLTVGLLVIVGLAACSPRSYSLLDIAPITVGTAESYYEDIAWLEENTLALLAMPSIDSKNSEVDLIIHELASGTEYQVPEQVSADCRVTWYGRISRLPNGLLGYLWECLPDTAMAGRFQLQKWNQVSHTDREIYQYPTPFIATAFSFAPDMSQWLQEETGDGLSNRLHYVVPNESPVRILEDGFARAGHPAWLRDGRIIFAGTPQLPESGTNLFSGLPGITADLAEPWNMYLTDLGSLLNGAVSEDQIILSDIQYIEAVKASPDGQFVSFLGTIDGNEGLWIYSLETGKLARFWAGFGPYDWSPDGKEIVMLVRDPEATVFRGQPERIVLPPYLTE